MKYPLRFLYQRHIHAIASALRYIIPTLIILGMISVAPFSASAHSQGRQQFRSLYQRIPGHAVPLLADAKVIGPTAQNIPLHLLVALKLRNETNLDILITAQEDPSSSLYHHYLTPQEFSYQYSPTQATVDNAATYLRQQGLQVGTVTSNHTLIDASTTVGGAEHAFAITINNYRLQSRVVYAPSINPLLPSDMIDKIATISGLNNVSIYHPLSRKSHRTLVPQPSSPDGGLTPSELHTQYDVTPLLQAGHDGAGQTLALFELDGYNPTDIIKYRDYYHLGRSNLTNVLVDGTHNMPGNDAVEVTLDMEVVAAMAPRASQIVYIGQNTPVGVADTYNRIVTDNVAKVVSISWGECELASSPARLDLLAAIFKQGAVQGQAFFAASGDYGAYDCPDTPQKLAVDSPASDPYVVGVGGTTLQAIPAATSVPESTWGDPLANAQDAGGGGGKSSHFLHPAYQTGPNLTDVYRLVPDVSAVADPNTGYSIYFTAKNANVPWETVGGTSAAAPLWAGIAIDINQQLQVAHVPSLGNALIALYSLYNTPQIYPAYHDIVTGSNLYYQASPGYDMATGMGTPDAWNIVRDLESIPAIETQLLQDTGFENGDHDWKEHSSGGYGLIGTTNPHLGQHSAYLCSYSNCHDSIAQVTVIPKFSRKVTLDYWLYIGRGDTSTNCQDNIQVVLRTTNGKLIQLVQKLCNTAANGWTPYSFDVTDELLPYVGQQMQAAFEASGVSGPRSNFFVDVDDVTLLDLSVAPGVTTQFINNPSFENGHAAWQESSSGGYELVTTTIPHSGQYSAYLCGYANCNDSISQKVILPFSTQKAALSYWVYIGRADSSGDCLNTFHSYLQLPTGSNTLTEPVQKLCNTDANGWTQYSFDVTDDLQKYLGKEVQIAFQAVGSNAGRANFFVIVDDVMLYVTHT